jgi:ketosteroid isomerase-like protein
MADQDAEAIAELIETYRQGFLALDARRLVSIWERDHKPLIYIAQEKNEPITGWAAIERYLEALAIHLETISSMVLHEVTIDPLGDAAVAYFRFVVKGKLKGHARPHEPVGRVTMLFRRTPHGWRVIHYHESALAAHAVEATT